MHIIYKYMKKQISNFKESFEYFISTNPAYKHLGICLICMLLFTSGVFSQTKLQKDFKQKLDQYFSIHAKNKNFSGNIIVAKNEKILFGKSYGKANYEWNIPQTFDTKIKIASVTKTFTSAATLLLVKQGKLSLNQTIDKYFPQIPSADKITVEHLLLHMSGLPNPDYLKLHPRNHLTNDEILQTIKSKPLLFEPGTKDRYSNSGYFVLALIIEKVSGKTYEEYIKENILEPLKLNKTGVYDDEALVRNIASSYSIGPNNNIVKTIWYSSKPSLGSGSMYSTANDLHKWGLAIKNKTLFDIYSVRYPYGWGRRTAKDGAKFITQTGYSNGYQSLLNVYENGYIIVFNSNIGNTFFNKVYDDVPAILFGKKYKIPKPQNYISLPTKSLTKYVGKYKFNNQPAISIQIDNNSLYYQHPQSSFRNYLVPITENSFEMREELSTVTFLKNEKGIFDRLKLTFSNGSNATALKVKK